MKYTGDWKVSEVRDEYDDKLFFLLHMDECVCGSVEIEVLYESYEYEFMSILSELEATENILIQKSKEEKKKQDKKLFDEELYDLQEASRLEASRDKTLFDRMMRDAEFNRDEKKRILALEKGTAEKNLSLIHI